MKNLFIIIAAIGILMTIYTDFNLMHENDIANFGPVMFSKTQSTPIYWSPITGFIVQVIGAIGFVTINKKEGN